MNDQRDVALKLIGEDKLKALDNSGLVIVARDERDEVLAKIGFILTENVSLRNKNRDDNKAELVAKIVEALQTTENDILNKIQQMQNALKPVATMPIGNSIEKKEILAAKEAINDKTEISPLVIKERRTSVYAAPRTTITTNKRPNVRIDRTVPNVTIKKDIYNVKNH